MAMALGMGMGTETRWGRLGGDLDESVRGPWLAALTAKQFAEISLKLNEIVKSISHILPLPVTRRKKKKKTFFPSFFPALLLLAPPLRGRYCSRSKFVSVDSFAFAFGICFTLRLIWL